MRDARKSFFTRIETSPPPPSSYSYRFYQKSKHSFFVEKCLHTLNKKKMYQLIRIIWYTTNVKITARRFLIKKDLYFIARTTMYYVVMGLFYETVKMITISGWNIHRRWKVSRTRETSELYDTRFLQHNDNAYWWAYIVLI